MRSDLRRACQTFLEDPTFPVLRSQASPVGAAQLVRTQGAGLSFDFTLVLVGRRYLPTQVKAVAVNGAGIAIGDAAWNVTPDRDPFPFQGQVEVPFPLALNDIVTRETWRAWGRPGMALRVLVTDAAGRPICTLVPARVKASHVVLW